jgi:hypothetical protein
MGGSMTAPAKVKTSSERKFYAGLVIVMLSFGMYGMHLRAGHTLGLYDVLFHAMPMTLGLALMAPKALPAIMGAVTQIFGRWRSTP